MSSRTIRGNEIAETRRERTQAAFYQWRLGCRRCYRTFTPDAQDAAIEPDEASFFGNEFRYRQVSNLTVQSLHGAASRIDIDTLIDSESDAMTEAARALTLTSANRDFHHVEVYSNQWLIREGDTITVTGTAELGIDLPEGLYMVLGLGESTTTGRTSLQLWG